MIALADVEAGRYRPAPGLAAALGLPDDDWLMKQCRHYCAALERAGKYQLYIWPEHCLPGSAGHMLAGVVHEARLFHAYVRAAPGHVEIKGGHALTENYSVFTRKCATAGMAVNWLGGAATCLTGCWRATPSSSPARRRRTASGRPSTTCSTRSRRATRRSPPKCYVVTDCMSAVTVPDGDGGFLADFTPQVEQAFERYAQAGMHLVDSTSALADLAGMRV